MVEMVDAIGVEEACAPHHAVDFVAFPEQELSEVGAVLPGNAGDQCTLRHTVQLPILNGGAAIQLIAGSRKYISNLTGRRLRT